MCIDGNLIVQFSINSSVIDFGRREVAARGVGLDNCDGDNYWFRILDDHPDPRFGELASAFRDEVCKHLGVAMPFPKIVWFQPAQAESAAREWQKIADANPKPKSDWSPNGNPFNTPSRIFKFPKEQPGLEIFSGYTHRDGPRLIGISVDCPDHSRLEAIAHECVHVLQDDVDPDWRMGHTSEAEVQADSRVEMIRSEFADWFEKEEHLSNGLNVD